MLNKIVLKEKLGTKYLIDYYANEMRKLMLSLPEQSTIDLAECKLGEQIAKDIENTWVHRHIFVDSKNEYMNRMLSHNRNITMLINDYTETIQFDFKNLTELTSYIKDFDRTKKYNIKNFAVAQQKCFAVLTILMLRYPDVNVDLGAAVTDFFKYVRLHWRIGLTRSYQRYFEARGFGIDITEVVDGKVYSLYKGWISEEEYKDDYLVIPYEFGTVSILEDRTMYDEFRSLWDTSAQILEVTGQRSLKLADFLLKNI